MRFILDISESESAEELEDRIAQELKNLDGQLFSPETGNSVTLEEKPDSFVEVRDR